MQLVKSVCCGNELSERSMWRECDGESNESMYERCDMEPCANGVICYIMEWVKINTLRWFDHIERENNEEFVKKV